MQFRIHFVIPIILLLWLTRTWTASASLAMPGCQERCGDVLIPYPFGIGYERNCSMGEGFEVICNTSFNPPKPFIKIIGMELLQVSVNDMVVQVMSPVRSLNCRNTTSSSSSLALPEVVDLSKSPFVFSRESNRFTAIGCDNFATISQYGKTIGGCMSICDAAPNVTGSGCYGLNCCQTTIPPNLYLLNMSITNINSTGRCMSASMVDQDWFNYNSFDENYNELSKREHVPVVLEWGRRFGNCRLSKSSDIFCDSFGRCWGSPAHDSLCVCIRSSLRMEGISYISDECYGTFYRSGSKNCTCPAGYENSQHGDGCYHLAEPVTKKFPLAILIGCLAAFGMILLLIGSWWMYKLAKKRNNIKLKEKYFKRNGGLLMQQQLSSSEGNIEKTKLFTSKELEKATDNYNENRILGQGGQGTVYKGMLVDGRIVAIKKSIMVDEDKLEQFINEVIILSQINHRNVVKLLGSCLETEVPLLVYEFIPNGTLFPVLHHQIEEEFLLTWEMRLRIAVEVASALSYLHSSASIPIYHRDIKSSNILLDDKYRAKISDFGTSRSVAVDQTHLTTQVLGTFGYLDPEYFQSSQFTDKSDVYSFGVVLIELLTGKKPISSFQSEDERSLTTHFLFLMDENRLFQIIDARVAKESRKEDIMVMANLARRCLNLNGKKRPTMREVTIELEGIRGSQGAAFSYVIDQSYEEVDYSEMTRPWDTASSSDTSLKIDTMRLL
ncbi:wall-associated receptor kinase-like 1 [Tripterygium wilfordii]|uniref:wall-associated receptor kinase-like 1 n=1 Tax=Tripterygium wilfordii TaxID=458696 RepID=UPI0018F80D92|nr:wall-associated receptor kinase-like 1 [Tripterygium wilfordii]